MKSTHPIQNWVGIFSIFVKKLNLMTLPIRVVFLCWRMRHIILIFWEGHTLPSQTLPMQDGCCSDGQPWP